MATSWSDPVTLFSGAVPTGPLTVSPVVDYERVMSDHALQVTSDGQLEVQFQGSLDGASWYAIVNQPVNMGTQLVLTNPLGTRAARYVRAELNVNSGGALTADILVIARETD